MTEVSTRAPLAPRAFATDEEDLGRRPYVGVSGVSSPYQANLILSVAHESGIVETHDVLLGFKATDKTHMRGVENKYGADWYPVGENIGDVANDCFGGQPWIRPVAQVFLDDPADAEYRSAFTSLLTRRCTGMKGIQYDLLPWHEPHLTDALTGYLAAVDDAGYDVYLQVHGPAMTLGPAAAAKAFEPYAPYVDHLLFDSSHGTGAAMDVTRLAEFLDAFARFGTGMGVAGGLGPDVPLADLLAVHPDLSWDAESRLHPQRPDGSRRLDLGLVEDYLRTSATLITSAQSKDPR